MKKRALSFFLMLIMVFALLPTSAYAKYTYDPAKAIAWATNKIKQSLINTAENAQPLFPAACGRAG